MTLLTFENVSKFYGASPALQNVSLEIPAGKIVGLWSWKNWLNWMKLLTFVSPASIVALKT